MMTSAAFCCTHGNYPGLTPHEIAREAQRAEIASAGNLRLLDPRRIGYAGGTLRATKIVWLGAAAANPAMTDIEIDRAPATDAELAITAQADIALSIPLPDERYDVTWLSSCGTMHDFDLPTARLRVEPDDRAAGQLALVVRDADGGPAGACGRSTRTDRTRRARVR